MKSMETSGTPPKTIYTLFANSSIQAGLILPRVWSLMINGVEYTTGTVLILV